MRCCTLRRREPEGQEGGRALRHRRSVLLRRGRGLRQAAEKLGLEVVDKESSSSADDTEYSAQLQKIQASGAELLYAPYYYSVAGPYIIPQARSVGFEAT